MKTKTERESERESDGGRDRAVAGDPAGPVFVKINPP